MKRSATLILCLATVAVGLWVLSGAQTLESACTFSAQTGGGKACVSGMAFYLLGMALCLTGAMTLVVQLLFLIRGIRLNSTKREPSMISTLHTPEVESLRDVA
jgi:hypothetical protein